MNTLILLFVVSKGGVSGSDARTAKYVPSSCANFKQWRTVFINVGYLLSWSGVSEGVIGREDSSF